MKTLFLTLIITWAVSMESFAQVECALNLTSSAGRPVLSGTPQYIATTHFKVHYTLTGTDATTLSRAQKVSQFAEEAYAAFQNLGWNTPPADLGNKGGDSRYDMYLRQLASANGVAIPEDYITGPYPDAKTSWIEITKDDVTAGTLTVDNFLRAIVAHELHHASQFTYTTNEGTSTWYFENTAVYMEDMVYDDVNRLANAILTASGTQNPLNTPQRNIDYTQAFGMYQYGGGLWPTFLHEKYGSDIVRKSWEKMGVIATPGVLPAIEQTLQENVQQSLSDAFVGYAEWRYFTGSRADDYHFSEANLYTISNTITIQSISLYGPGGCNFYEIPFSPGGMTVTVNASANNLHWRVLAVEYRPGSISIVHEIELDVNNMGEIFIPMTGNNKLTIIPVMIDENGTPSGENSITISYESVPTYFNVEFANKFNTQNLGGTLTLNVFIPLSSGDYYPVDGFQSHHIKTDNERFTGSPILKHWSWNTQPINYF